MQLVFVHPDLGIGGAERLVVDAALALKSKGHRVSFITGHHDRKHCFEGMLSAFQKIMLVLFKFATTLVR